MTKLNSENEIPRFVRNVSKDLKMEESVSGSKREDGRMKSLTLLLGKAVKTSNTRNQRERKLVIIHSFAVDENSLLTCWWLVPSWVEVTFTVYVSRLTKRTVYSPLLYGKVFEVAPAMWMGYWKVAHGCRR